MLHSLVGVGTAVPPKPRAGLECILGILANSFGHQAKSIPTTCRPWCRYSTPFLMFATCPSHWTGSHLPSWCNTNVRELGFRGHSEAAARFGLCRKSLGSCSFSGWSQWTELSCSSSEMVAADSVTWVLPKQKYADDRGIDSRFGEVKCDALPEGAFRSSHESCFDVDFLGWKWCAELAARNQALLVGNWFTTSETAVKDEQSGKSRSLETFKKTHT